MLSTTSSSVSTPATEATGNSLASPSNASFSSVMPDTADDLSASSSGEEILVIPVHTIVDKVTPLCGLSVAELHALVLRYDTDGVGGLTEPQWSLFCHENRHAFSSLGEELLDFDRSGEYSVLVVKHGYEGTSNINAPRSFTKEVIRFIESFAAGGIAGAVSKTVIAPGDRVKIIFQVEPTRHFSLREAVYLGVETVQKFGITGLWIGNGATMLRVVPYAAITYASFDFYHSKLRFMFSRSNPDGSSDEARAVTLRFISGSLAGATSTTCTYPLDLMRARFAARSSSGKRRFPSYSAAFKEATSKQGFLSLYGGLFPTLVGIVPYAGCSFACFETLKHYIVKVSNLKSDKDIPTYQRLVAGGFAGLLAQSATYPLDIVRRRMQVTPRRYSSVIDALRTVYREEGIRQGLYKGLAMNWIKGPIATATSFTVNDLVKRRTRNYYETTVVYSSRHNIVTLPEAFLCGGVAAATAKFFSLPFDRLKILYQVGMTEKTSAKKGAQLLYQVVKQSPNMWTSGHVTMLRVVPYGALTYCFFDMFQLLAERLMYSHVATPYTNFAAGAAAASLGTTIVYPLDLLRTRVAVNAVPSFQSYFWLLRAMARRHGIGSLWKGCYFSMMGVGVLGGIGFALYDYLKERFGCHTFLQYMAAGATSGLAGSVITYPLNVMKRNRQAERVVYAQLGTSSVQSLLKSPKTVAFLYRKMPFSFTVSSLTFGISFAVNDWCRDVIAATRNDMLREMLFLPSFAVSKSMLSRGDTA
ncbi:putative mitochondrial carrier protein [Leishmania infantum JPCM5]|uniref:Mitochondrial_carrier_protein_-_putative n=2 Tax=Leishmania infantum TaxID=5671 RepID=A0A6L0XTJ5_LEIIN|nr:putative mitochondrial carrier protein [Leishmania infantum JPCM5]CAC9548881.1 mitochondrial_carrier_protein_-_putative [Leishmania infantum]CAM72664.1 putative mitochondrial carrier protein [Leishmania infantum JPCM5]SUZ46424.1 mitochondrial_carrier_protein_-_putative [Leishmania infantum]|eukprot:XP_001469555.1 putative mitochondrial carrier protein [Leishmania infantum JPCM5]